jgi:hypothetical protein
MLNASSISTCFARRLLPHVQSRSSDCNPQAVGFLSGDSEEHPRTLCGVLECAAQVFGACRAGPLLVLPVGRLGGAHLAHLGEALRYTELNPAREKVKKSEWDVILNEVKDLSSSFAIRAQILRCALNDRWRFFHTFSGNGRCGGFLSVVRRRGSFRDGAARRIAGYATLGAVLDNR